MKELTAVFITILIAASSPARIITVDDDAPADFTTIQAAINDANDGDIIEIQPGTYTGDGNRDIDFLGKAITVTSTDPNDPNTVAQTIIDCNGTAAEPHRGFLLISDEEETSVLAGLTITKGYMTNDYGGAICGDYSSPTIRNCIITGNYAREGGGIYKCWGEITNCIISNNRAYYFGGGLRRSGYPVRNCVIINNSADGTSDAEGGGFYHCGQIINCTIAFNSSWGRGGGGYLAGRIVNSIIFHNSAINGTDGVEGCSNLRYSCLQNGTGPGCINSDPMLAPDGYHLLPGSPCINSGDPNGGFSTQTDIDGEPRVMGSSIEMGVDEFTDSVLPPVALEITGRSEVRSGYSAQYNAIASYDDVPARYVTTSAIFWVSPPEYGTVDNSGLLTSVLQETAHDITIHARYTEGGATVEADFVVHMYVAPRVLWVPSEFSTIQEAVEAAGTGDSIVLQPGTYSGEGNNDIDFLGRAITIRSIDPNDPNAIAQTIISGGSFVFQSGEDRNSILDGLTIPGGGIGCVDGSSPTIRNCTVTDRYSSAIYCDGGSSPMITNCVFTSNWDSIAGGAIYCKENCNLVINDCLFADNEAEDGGAIYCCMDSTLTIYRCVFQENLATDRYGGAIRIKESKATIVDSTFQYNQAGDWMWPGLGGAILCTGTSTELTANNCLFIGNSSNYAIGALGCGYRTHLTNCIFAGNYSRDYGASLAGGGSGLTIENCTFVGNYSESGGSLDLYGNTHIRNSIVWDGPDSIVLDEETTLLACFSDVQGRIPGYRNIDADPCFANPGRWVDSRDPNIVVDPSYKYAVWVNGDYHLKSQAGRWDSDDGRRMK